MQSKPVVPSERKEGQLGGWGDRSGRGGETHTQFMPPSQQLILAKSSQIITVGTSGYLFSCENSKASKD